MQQVEGLCGNYDGDKNNDFGTSSGILSQSVAPFAESWADESCNDDNAKGSSTSPCNIYAQLLSNAENKCAHVGGSLPLFAECKAVMSVGEFNRFRESCVHDMCANSASSSIKPVCVWVAALARACKENGVIVDWIESPKFSECRGNFINHLLFLI